MDKTHLILVAAIIALPLIVVFVRKWTVPFYFIFVYPTLSGIVTYIALKSTFGLLLKDFLFVLPAYLGFLPLLRRRIRFIGIPSIFTLFVTMFCCLVVIQLINPHPRNPGLLVGMVGVKTWLFYIPLVLLTYVHVSDSKRFITLLRVITCTVWIACPFGIAQRVLVQTFGYKKVMKKIYGEYAETVTQHFSSFMEFGAAEVYRIPATFTFFGQYGNFILGALCFCYIHQAIDPNRKWKHLASMSLVLLCVAGFTSGQRSLFLIIPVVLALQFIIHQKILALPKLGLVLGLSWILLNLFGNFEIFEIIRDSNELVKGNIQGHISQSIWNAIFHQPMGIGTGASTIGARHVLQWQSDSLALIPSECTLAKTIVELGILGGILYSIILLIPWFVSLQCYFRFQSKEIRAVIAGCFTYSFVVFFYSFKGFVIDTTPTHVYYWAMLGILFRVNAMGTPSSYPLRASMPPGLKKREIEKTEIENNEHQKNNPEKSETT